MTNKSNTSLKYTLWKEYGQYIAYNKEYDISGYGSTEKKAVEMLKIAKQEIFKTINMYLHIYKSKKEWRWRVQTAKKFDGKVKTGNGGDAYKNFSHAVKMVKKLFLFEKVIAFTNGYACFKLKNNIEVNTQAIMLFNGGVIAA